VQPVNWTGFYLGGFGGATQGTADWGYAEGSVAPHVAGYLFGGTVGYNWQIDPSYVVGVEADIASTYTRGGMSCGGSTVSAGLVSSPMFEMTCNAWSHWVATAAARVGYVWDRAMFYGKLGGAWTKETVEADCNFGVFNVAPNPTPCRNPAGQFSNGLQQTSKTLTGWVIGWGTEYALTRNWSAKGEADYISFGDRNVVAQDTVAGNIPSTLKVGMHIWEEKIGVNYKF
jgi:opacity protein-like surface antigen